MANNESIQQCQKTPLLDLRYLLDNFRKSVKFWFLEGNWASKNLLIDACTDILMHGLVQANKENDCTLEKFMEDLEWIRKSTSIKDLDALDCAQQNKSASSSAFMHSTKNPMITLQQFLNDWVLRNLENKTMCASIETLIIIEKEFLEINYDESAFLRTECYAHAFIIGLSAFELNQYSLLSKIDKSLYTNSIHLASFVDATDGVDPPTNKHKRTTSHPNFSLSLPRSNDLTQATISTTKDDEKSKCLADKKQKVFPVFRKTKSLPIICKSSTDSVQQIVRPRSKTLVTINRNSRTKNIPKAFELNHAKKTLNDHPSSSVNSCDSQLSNSTNNSSNTTNSDCLSASPNTIAKRIELINCDDIKIWTDQSFSTPSPRRTVKERNLETCGALSSPMMSIKKPKSISPINSFFSSLFGTPPAYSTWYAGDEETENECSNIVSSSSTGGDTYATMSVFDSFMPVYGKKVQSKQKSNLFEDGISTLDYKPTITYDETPVKSKTNESTTSKELPRTPANCQSLTAFLQMAQLSRNNTELEKENAHFRISEAIISAIEHIKWAKSQHKNCQNEAVVATDWLENERKSTDAGEKQKSNVEQQEEETILADSNEHDYIPFVEHSESCLESLSAEVVGLSLISRFNNDKNMPKVSELKWLVSDEDTPQQLLPMPDNSLSANPDEHIFPPMVRGTRYWAPPRPQIIFTVHPTPNRKALIRKQNNRCAGCGMRVSPQYMSSFRYCTYFGKYHCTGCHRNQMSSTPAKILEMWDFRCYPVSVFAYRLLEQIYSYPLFHVPDLNAALYIKSKQLHAARSKRLKLKYVKDFIKTCRFAQREQSYFDAIPDHITCDVDTWSMSDFVEARNENMQRSINELIEKCENHIFHCVLCLGRGFCCEYCLRDRAIYPWEDKVFRCDRCGSCFHLSCWKTMLEVCCRCKRIWNRQNEVTELKGEK